MWDLNIVEEEETIIHGIIPNFWSDITNIPPFQGFVSLHIPYRDHERMRAVIFATNDELSHHRGVIGRTTQRTDPPFGGGQRWGMHYEDLAFSVPGSGGFEGSHIGSVAWKEMDER